jgi:hypothetical protein
VHCSSSPHSRCRRDNPPRRDNCRCRRHRPYNGTHSGNRRTTSPR